jgi:ammonium transporter, Amt family
VNASLSEGSISLEHVTEGDRLMRRFDRISVLVRVAALGLTVWCAGSVATAQMPGSAAPAAASQTDRLAALEKSSADQAAAIAAAQSAGDNGWMLVSSALVLLMSGPGLALFYGGLVRRKNVLGTMMQTFAP